MIDIQVMVTAGRGWNGKASIQFQPHPAMAETTVDANAESHDVFVVLREALPHSTLKALQERFAREEGL